MMLLGVRITRSENERLGVLVGKFAALGSGCAVLTEPVPPCTCGATFAICSPAPCRASSTVVLSPGIVEDTRLDVTEDERFGVTWTRLKRLGRAVSVPL